MPEKSLKESIARQRKDLAEKLEQPMEKAARKSAAVWPDREKLNRVLEDRLHKISHCKYLYAMDRSSVQISDNISREGRITGDYRRDRSARPYMQSVSAEHDFHLSEAYISLRGNRPSLTAVHRVHDDQGSLLGYIGADFDLRDMLKTRAIYDEPKKWIQVKGDPSIRGGVFAQQRIESLLDINMDTILSVLAELIEDHGIFHIMLHFSSSRAVVWHYDDPYRYRLLAFEELIDPDICLAFPRKKFPKDSMIPSVRIGDIFQGFRELRFIDDMLYLRTGTINIFNGIIGLTFSCDGSHYIPWEEFLDRNHVLWSNESIV